MSACKHFMCALVPPPWTITRRPTSWVQSAQTETPQQTQYPPPLSVLFLAHSSDKTNADSWEDRKTRSPLSSDFIFIH